MKKRDENGQIVRKDAMSRVENRELETEDELKAFTGEISRDWPRPDTTIPQLKEDLAQILIQEGFPDPRVRVTAPSEVFAGQSVSLFGWAYVKREVEREWRDGAPDEGMPLAYEAALLFKRVVEVEQALEFGDQARVFAESFRLGSEVNAFNARRGYLKTVAKGKSFTAPNTGAQARTQKRRALLRAVAEEIGTTKRHDVVIAAERHAEFASLFRGYDQAYRFATPDIFDGIRKR